MDVKKYFRKLREMEAAFEDDFPIVVSVETQDGGKPGQISEVSRYNAAKMLVERRAVLATEEQKQQFKESQAAARLNAEKLELSRRLQVAIVSDSEFAGQLHSRNSKPTIR